MIRPLIIAPHFLLENVTNGQLERTFVNNLPQGYEPVIVCEKYANGLGKECSNYDIYEIRRNTIVNAFQGVCERLHICSFASTPDRDRLSCVPRALCVVNGLFDKYKFDYIHTISMPCSAHTLGSIIKLKYNIPWVAQFYDPWRGNPTRLLSGGALKKDIEFENDVAENADVIIQPNESLKKFWIRSYGRNIEAKIQIIPFIANVDEIHDRQCCGRKRLNITHIGGLSIDRNTSFFLKGLLKCFNAHPEVRDKVIVRYVGDITSIEENFIQTHSLTDVVHYVGRLPEKECAKYYEDADIFLIVDLNCAPNLFYPSKLVKYFYYNKPILGLVTDGGTVQYELTITNNHPYGYYDIDGIADFIYKAIIDYPSVCTNDIKHKDVFDKVNVIRQYDSCIKDLISAQI